MGLHDTLPDSSLRRSIWCPWLAALSHDCSDSLGCWGSIPSEQDQRRDAVVRNRRLRRVNDQLEIDPSQYLFDERLAELALHEVVTDDEADAPVLLGKLKATLD